MRFNLWKVSTLVLAGALTIIVGRGAVVDADACEIEDASFEDQDREEARIRLGNAVRLIQRAEQEVRLATAAKPDARAKALTQLRIVRTQVASAAPDRMVRPKPRGRMAADEVAFGFER